MATLFLTGATGYIGGSIAAGLVAGGQRVRGLVRSAAGAARLEGLGIEPVLGTLDDAACSSAKPAPPTAWSMPPAPTTRARCRR